jgi:hypothetical protein
MELFSAGSGSREIGSNLIGHGLHLRLRCRQSPRSPMFRNARAVTFYFVPGLGFNSPQQGFQIITSPPRLASGSGFLPARRAALKKVMSSM